MAAMLDTLLGYVDEALLVVFGWALGFAGTAGRDAVRARRERRQIRNGVLLELSEVRIRLVLQSFLIGEKFGGLTAALLKWMERHMASYKGASDVSQSLEAVRGLLKGGQQTIKAVQTYGIATAGGGLALKTCSLAFLESNIGRLCEFDNTFQRKTLEIRTQVEMLNQDVAEAQDYLRRTFDSSVSSENQQIIADNLDAKYQRVRRASMRIADLISAVLGEPTSSTLPNSSPVC
jgi:hypothetical protein